MSDDLEKAITAGVVAALRKKAAALGEVVKNGTTHPDDHPNVDLITPEAAMAERMCRELTRLADEMEAENG